MTPEEFRKTRIEMKLSCQKMAEFCGLKAGRTIRRYESGELSVPEYVIKILELSKVINGDKHE